MRGKDYECSLLLALDMAGDCKCGRMGRARFLWSGGRRAPAGQPPFANPVEQRADMIRELREIKELLKEQNALLKSGVGKPNGNNSALH